MKKDIEWLKEKLLRELMQFNSNPSMTDYEIGIKSGIRTAINLTEKLDEQEVLSQKMADELKRYKGLGYSLKDLLVTAGSKQEQEKLARAWLDGYEVAEEPKFYVLDKEDATLLKKTASQGVIKSIGMNIYNVKSCKDEEKYQLTEQEIKDYDERFWAFAEEVTE